jgi:O-methyltransferase
MVAPSPGIVKCFKEIVFHTPLRKYLFPRFGYGFNSQQICFICQCIEETQSVPGAIAEVGCSDGSSTVFFNNYLDSLKSDKKYFALDTFSGFVRDDIEFEVKSRAKEARYYKMFRVTKKKWFEWTMHYNGISRVIAIQADVNSFDLKSLGPLSFVLLDVDLYRPTKKSLTELYAVLSSGGLIVVDDCSTLDRRWDGANQAYCEFMLQAGRQAEIVHGKLGIVRKL